MNARERLMASLSGEETDRVPIWLLFPYAPTGYYVDVRKSDVYRPIYEMSKEYAIMLNRRNLGTSVFTPEVAIETRDETRDGAPIKLTVYSHNGLALVKENCGLTGRVLKPLIANNSDLEMLSEFPFESDPARIHAQLEGQLPKYLTERDEFPEEYGAMMLDLGEPISFLYHNMNLEEFSIWSITHDDAIKELLERLMARYRIVYDYCLERDLADIYFMVGSELAAPPMVSVETFNSWIVPYAKELIDMAHSEGKKVIQHFHGQIRHLLTHFVEMGADGLHTIEAPPVGNCTMTQAYDVVGDKITLIGNIQYDDFRAWTAEQMAKAVIELLDECRGKRFILSPTAGPFDQNPPPQIIENYKTFMKTAWDYTG